MQNVRRIGKRKEKLKRKFFDEKRKTFSFVVANFFFIEYNKKMGYSIKEIAKIAGVSVSTVSKALNGLKGVSDEKRKEIEKIASEYGYTPNASARALSRQATDTIGLVIPTGEQRELLGSYWSEMIQSIAEESSKNGYNLLLLVPNVERRLESLRETVLRQNVDGLIFPAEELSREAMELLEANNVPFVVLGRSAVAEHYNVDIKNTSGSRALASIMLENGAKKPVCIAGPKEIFYSVERAEAFRLEIEEKCGFEPPILFTKYSEEAATAEIREFLSDKGDTDGVFITAGGEFAFYALKVMKEMDFDMQKVRVAVFDDYSPLHFLPFKVITASQPIKKMGSMSAKNLFSLIKGDEPPSLSLFDIIINK